MVQGGFFCSHSGNDNYLPARIRGYTTGIFWHPVPLRHLKTTLEQKPRDILSFLSLCHIFFHVLQLNNSFLIICLHMCSFFVFLGQHKSSTYWVRCRFNPRFGIVSSSRPSQSDCFGYNWTSENQDTPTSQITAKKLHQIYGRV